MKSFATGFVFLWFLLGGIAHFVFDAAMMKIMPPYVPAPLAVIHISGVFELLGAFGLLLASTRKLAGNCLIALTMAVSLANIHMWQHPELFPQFPEWLLSFRLLFQVLFMLCIYWVSRPDNQALLISIRR
ncbi:hypothetical protein [Pseudomethylobacillus aquaticus]|uniref:DoxX family protein n=1 Tax=Pseudomethylobacillus aquaticus TaxID=2676064 RepID=UPI0019621A15|nr:hypothetical protein [Pseudomethylobacillus aquaticus]